jgi:tetraacyldisaccharide 4'-kinase
MTDWQNRITASWATDPPGQSGKPSFLTVFLSLLSLPYRMAVSARNSGYDLGILKQHRLPCKVISVGNITVGGTGKTPMTIMLASLLQDAGWRPAILSRGYGGKTTSNITIISNGRTILTNPAQGGDEPVLMARACPSIPVIKGSKRQATGIFAVNHFGVDVVILDDGFQHRSLYRDVDVVLIDAQRPFGNGRLLPRGPLRETATALRRADIIVKTGIQPDPSAKGSSVSLDNAKVVFRGYRRPKAFIKGTSGESHPLDDLRGKRICAFAGIASPDSFKKTLERLGLEVSAWIPFSDHHRYTEKDITEIQRISLSAKTDAIVTTEKDGVKLWEFADFLEQLFLLRIDMAIEPSQDEMKAILLNKFQHR